MSTFLEHAEHAGKTRSCAERVQIIASVAGPAMDEMWHQRAHIECWNHKVHKAVVNQDACTERCTAIQNSALHLAAAALQHCPIRQQLCVQRQRVDSPAEIALRVPCTASTCTGNISQGLVQVVFQRYGRSG